MLRSHTTVTFALALTCGFAAHASGNEFLSDRTADWFRYRDARTGQEVESRIATDGGGWRMWRNFAGLGARWVYTAANHDYLWVWNGRAAQLLANLSGAVGSSSTVDLGTLNRGRVRVAARGTTLDTPAGRFTDVTVLELQTSGADAGVTAISFARGVGVVRWVEQSIAGPREYVLAGALVRGQTLPAAAPVAPPATAPAGATRAPAEHAQLESVLWGCNDTYLVIDTYVDAFSAMHGSGVGCEVTVDSNQTAAQLRYELTAQNVPLDELELLVAALDSVWMRDYGPIVLKSPAGERLVADLDYYPGRYDDDAFPAAYAVYKGWRRVQVDLSYEGGNFATDGRGLGLASRGVLWFNPNLTRTEVEAELRKLGCDRVELFEPLADEGTTHIDMFARVMSDTQVLVSSYPSGHRQRAIVDAAASRLRTLGYGVTRVEAAYGYDEYATYANSVLVNGRALVPQYGDAARDRAARDAYTQLGYQAFGIDSRLIIRYGGATHCLSMQVPR